MKLYLDTSVFRALLDLREPSRQALTQAFWDSKGQYEVLTGEIARQEINENRNPELRSKMLNLLFGIEVLPITSEVLLIHENLLRMGPFSARTSDDAMHIATASANQVDILLS